MNFTGQITKVLELQEGTSQAGKVWAKREVVVTESNPRNPEYPQAIKVEFFKTEDHIKWIKEEWNHNEGDTVTLEDLSFKTSEYKGKYYTNISCFKIVSEGSQERPSAPAPSGGMDVDNSDLPF